jgi:hypothetical protein
MSGRPQPARGLPEQHPITTRAEASNAERNARRRCRSVGCHLAQPRAPRKSAFNVSPAAAAGSYKLDAND